MNKRFQVCTHQEGDGVRTVVAEFVGKVGRQKSPDLSHSLDALREAILHSLDENRRNRLISRTDCNPVHLCFVSQVLLS